MRPRPDALFSFALLVMFVWAVWEARNWPQQARLFPWVIGFPMAALALWQLVLDLLGRERKKSGFESELGEGLEPAEVRRRIAIILGWVAAFFLLITFLGFPYAVPLGMFLYLKVGSRESWLVSVVVTVISYAIFWGLFINLLNMPFPEGLLLSWIPKPP